MEETKRTSLHTVQAGATSPLLRSLITGGFVGAIMQLLAINIASKGHHAMDWSVLYWGLYGFLITSALTWLFLQWKFSQILYWIEMATGVDINRDNQLGKPEPTETEPTGVKITVRDVSDGHLSIMNYEFDMITNEQLIAFARGTANGGSLAVDRWSGSGRTFSKPKYMLFRDELERRKWVVPIGRGRNQGFELTRAGKAVMREIVREYAPHSPTDAGNTQDA